jgi:hypothetical protein
MKRKSASKEEKGRSPSQLIDARIKELDDWRSKTLSHVRALIKQADPAVVEEWKWRGVPVWSHNGIICTVLIPAKKRLVVQTVSVYRSGAISASTVQIFMNTSVHGTYASYALPLIPASAASYVGTTFNGVFYADADTELLANAFRDSTSGAETDTVSVTGYLVNVP